MSNSISDTIAALNAGGTWINRVIPPVQIVFGTFGNIFNIIIFTRPTLRTNPCAFHFLVGSVNNLFLIYTSFLSRVLIFIWNIDASNLNDALCKVRNFVIYPPLELILWFVVLASVDHFLSSSESVRLRQLSSLPIARKVVVAVVLFAYLIHVIIFFFFYVTDAVCTFPLPAYTAFFLTFYALFALIIPVVLLVVFGILTLRNVYKIRHWVGPQDDNLRNERVRSNDRQMLLMLLFQPVICLLLTAPFAAINLYQTFFAYILGYKRQPYEQAVYSFSYNLFRMLQYTTAVIGFYIYTLMGTKFRMEFKRCTRHGLKAVLTATKLMPYLPLNVQQVLFNENEIGTINRFNTQPEGRNNAVQRIQQQQLAITITVL